MVAKPYSSSHIAAVSSHFTTMRLSGDVKDRLVTLLCEELDRLVPRMEDETLTQDPERKTLDDPRRSRLNYNRTRVDDRPHQGRRFCRFRRRSGRH